MQREDTPPSKFTPISSPYQQSFASSVAAPTDAHFRLEAATDSLKARNPAQPYQTQGAMHQHGMSIGGNLPEGTTGKKARFTSDSNIPSVFGMGLGPSTQAILSGSQAMPSAKQPQHQTQQTQQVSQPTQQQSSVYASQQPTQYASAAQQGLPSTNASALHSSGLGQSRSYLSNGSASVPSVSGPAGTAPSTSPFATSSPSPYHPSLNLSQSSGANVGFVSAAGLGTSPQPAPYLANPSMYGAYSAPPFSGNNTFVPNMGLVSPPPGNQTGRTVYVGNLPAEASVDELFNQVKFGPIESVRVLPEKNCAFISFLDGSTAAAFHADASVKKLSLHGQELKIGWGKPSACPTSVLVAVQQNQATRNVYVQLGQDDNVTEESLRDDLSRFGPIDQVKIVRDKNIGFIHFLSIGTAMKVVSQLPQESAWQGKRINYGKDRCAYVPKSQQQNQAHNSAAAAMGMAAAASLGYPTAFGFSGLPASAPAGQSAFSASASEDRGGAEAAGALQQLGNRTIYLGNIHPETTTEEICNHIRGGILQTIRYIPDKHIAFVTFVDANSALAFHHLASYTGVMIHNRRLKIGWGKHSGPLSPAIAMAVQAGASRNVYVGNIEDADALSEEKLRNDFSEHGDVELVNSLREKNCAFVNFCNISNAIKAIEAMKGHADYVNVKISHGKDRCGRTMQLGGLNAQSGGNGGGQGARRRQDGSRSSPAPTTALGATPTNATSPPVSTGGASTANASAGLTAEGGVNDMPPINTLSLDGSSSGR